MAVFIVKEGFLRTGPWHPYYLKGVIKMASRHEIKCVNKSDRYNPHERITAIGGVNPNGTNWKLSQEEAVRSIEAGRYQFFVKAGGRIVDVIVAVSRYGHKYLKTVADGEHPNNLLSLYECVH
ncbi:DUF3892 domain-containing protein [Schlegelella sp. S2-27]|uniref:DUF3892 domain-containing protein n=1 Tax=Caldimonas mangrovi TaxID=2944811 RepID=A0ABT0YUY1_9BURK|nr:DUF3892 domain-containing protein [Caldimonas mangrovi]